jgi:biotin carboxyl carrier protein
MKMEMTLTATRAGTVAEIAVDVSTQVTEGALLVSVQVEEDR